MSSCVSVHEKIRQNQAGGDTTQITDFAQTWHKCWIWWVNDCDRKVGQNMLFFKGTPCKNGQKFSNECKSMFERNRWFHLYHLLLDFLMDILSRLYLFGFLLRLINPSAILQSVDWLGIWCAAWQSTSSVKTLQGISIRVFVYLDNLKKRRMRHHWFVPSDIGWLRSVEGR